MSWRDLYSRSSAAVIVTLIDYVSGSDYFFESILWDSKFTWRDGIDVELIEANYKHRVRCNFLFEIISIIPCQVTFPSTRESLSYSCKSANV